MSRFDEAMEFLLGDGVTLYTNAERTGAPPCPTCGAEKGEPCRALKSRCRLDKWHPTRTADPVPRSEEELLAILEKLARRYARTYDPMASYGPRRYPRC